MPTSATERESPIHEHSVTWQLALAALGHSPGIVPVPQLLEQLRGDAACAPSKRRCVAPMVTMLERPPSRMCSAKLSNFSSWSPRRTPHFVRA